MREHTTLPPFSVTRAAVEAIESFGGALRIDVEEGGCCGTTYSFSLVEAESQTVAGDEQYGCTGAWLFVSPGAAPVLRGATLALRRQPETSAVPHPAKPQSGPHMRLPSLVGHVVAGSAATDLSVI